MTYISSLVKYLECERCGYYYDASLSISGPVESSGSAKFLVPQYEMGTDGNWYYFCPICRNRMVLKF